MISDLLVHFVVSMQYTYNNKTVNGILKKKGKNLNKIVKNMKIMIQIKGNYWLRTPKAFLMV